MLIEVCYKRGQFRFDSCVKQSLKRESGTVWPCGSMGVWKCGSVVLAAVAVATAVVAAVFAVAADSS